MDAMPVCHPSTHSQPTGCQPPATLNIHVRFHIKCRHTDDVAEKLLMFFRRKFRDPVVLTSTGRGPRSIG
jgi:hypothetical protein